MRWQSTQMLAIGSFCCAAALFHAVLATCGGKK
jgi:hypothetical protein